jgi:hypothetical protein
LIVCAPQSWLFSAGQELRLREGLIEKDQVSIETVLTMPPGIYSTSNVVTAVVSLLPGVKSEKLWMGQIEVKSRKDSVDEAINGFKEVVLSHSETPDSRTVSYDEVRRADYVLLPQRLMRIATLDDDKTVELGRVSDLIRPTTPYRAEDGERVIEMGIPNIKSLDWLPIGELDESEIKRTMIRQGSKPDIFLAANDVIISVKGTLGLTRLVSDFYKPELGNRENQERRAVLSTSCVAIRLNKQGEKMGLSAQYILRFLRSAQGQEQIKSLQVGAGMPHISLQSLMTSIRVPLPSTDELKELDDEYEQLCGLENQITSLKRQMDEVVESRWVLKLA